MLIIEGHDNSGKSTLAKHLASMFYMTIQESEGPPLSNDEINERCRRYAARADERVIFVRHPVVSNAIYGKYRSGGDVITPEVREQFYSQSHTFIYCDPLDRGLADHKLKPHDTEQHINLLNHNRMRILMEYRHWAVRHAHIIYRIGDGYPRIVSQLMYDYAS